MTKQRIADLDKPASGDIAECLEYGQAENPALKFWKGAKMVLDELKWDVDNPQPTSSAGQANFI